MSPNAQNSGHVFSFNWQRNGAHVTFDASVPIPLDRTVDDYVAMLGTSNGVPCFAIKDLRARFQEFVVIETDVFFSKQGDNDVEAFLMKPKTTAMSTAQEWDEVYKQGTKVGMATGSVTNREVFRNAYQSLLHSDPGGVTKMLEKERQLANEMHSLIERKTEAIAEFQTEPSELIQNAVQEYGIAYSDQDINQITARHFEQIQAVETEYESKIASLAESQRKEYEDFVVGLHERHVMQGGAYTVAVKPDSIRSASTVSALEQSDPHRRESVRKPGLEESFTINLGAQMKTMHNLRLVAMDPLDLCRHNLRQREDSQQLHMALSLYSNELDGVVLLVSPRTRHHINLKTDFMNACEQSTELHFDDLATQLSEIEKDLKRAGEWRNSQALARQSSSPDVARAGLHSTGSPISDVVKQDRSNLSIGDVYITRHSNLAQVHVAFHLVEDEDLKSRDITSRHPAINGIRNIMRLAIRFGVTNLTLPLLLVDRITEEMTVTWCLKRAELVFKCVKGFMMESLTLHGTAKHQQTVQFLVPPEISSDLFAQLSDMLPQIFHIARPVMAVNS